MLIIFISFLVSFLPLMLVNVIDDEVGLNTCVLGSVDSNALQVEIIVLYVQEVLNILFRRW